MKREILNYFLLFGNPNEIDPTDNYWERDYVELWQIIFGILAFPIVIPFLILNKILKIRIK